MGNCVASQIMHVKNVALLSLFFYTTQGFLHVLPLFSYHSMGLRLWVLIMVLMMMGVPYYIFSMLGLKTMGDRNGNEIKNLQIFTVWSLF